MLNKIFIENEVYLENSLGFIILPKQYYDEYVCARGQVRRLYKINLTNTIKCFDPHAFLCNLDQIVVDKDIQRLIESYLCNTIVDENGKDLTDELALGVPPVGFITRELQHFYLVDLDHWMKEFFPKFSFTRYGTEVFVYFSIFSSNEDPKEKWSLSRFLYSPITLLET